MIDSTRGYCCLLIFYWLHYPNHVYKNSDILDYSIGAWETWQSSKIRIITLLLDAIDHDEKHIHTIIKDFQVFFLKHNFIISAKIWINSIFTSVSYILSHVKSGFRNYSVALDCCVREMGIQIMLLPYGLVLTIYPIYSEIHLVYIKIQYSSDVSISHEKCHLVHKGILFTQVASPCPLFTWVHGLF